MNMQRADPQLPSSIPKFSHYLSSSLHAPRPSPVTLFSLCVCVCQGECISVKPEGRPTAARGSFLWLDQCVSRRLAGVLGASSFFQLHSLTLGSLQRVFANSYCSVISRSSRVKPVLRIKHLLKMTSYVWETCQVEDNKEEGMKDV